MLLTFRPIKVWPDGWQSPNRRRTGSPFTATYSATLELLDRELWHLGATACTLQVDASERDVRLDGALRVHAHELWREGAKTHHPDVGGDPDTFRKLTEARDLLTGKGAA